MTYYLTGETASPGGSDTVFTKKFSSEEEAVAAAKVALEQSLVDVCRVHDSLFKPLVVVTSDGVRRR